jgi:DNA recombination protein RmuC
MEFALAIAALAASIAAVVWVRRAAGAAPGELRTVREQVSLLAQRLESDSARLFSRLEGIDTRMVHTQAQSSELAASIFATLGDVARHTATVAQQAREFTALQNLLRPPKARGGVGEAMLEQLLRQVLPPPAYMTQHRFSSGVVVDAVVRAGERLVPIDSKFPLSNYARMCDAAEETERAEAERAFARDVERHVRDIASRYLLPDEGTTEFAVMYVPAEGVYGEVLRLTHRKRPLLEIALEARVVPMSPLTMYGYLETVMFGLKCLTIEKSAERVLGLCGRLQRDLESFAADYETLGRHILNARARHEEGARRLDRVRDGLDRVGRLDEDGEAVALEAVPDRRLG